MSRAPASITWRGRTQTVTAWAAEIGVDRRVLYARLKRGLAGEALFKGVRRQKTIRIIARGKCLTLDEWSAKTGVDRHTLYMRCRRGLTGEALLTAEKQKNCSYVKLADKRDLAPGTPGALHWHCEPWDLDPNARAVVREFGALTLTCLGAVFGVSRERIRQIERDACLKLRYALQLVELIGEDAALAELEMLRGKRVPAYRAAVVRAAAERHKEAA